jgi:hypothetical protein
MFYNSRLMANTEYVAAYTANFVEQHGKVFKGYPVIGHDSPVRGGVYTGLYGGEALIVNPYKNPEEYDRYYREAAARLPVGGLATDQHVLQATFDTVLENMPYDTNEVEVDKILADLSPTGQREDFVDGTKVELGIFMFEGVGVCRHQTLAAVALLEMFRDDGRLTGATSTDRSQRNRLAGRWPFRRRQSDGHAWGRYTDLSGNVTILDVASEYIGPPEGDGRWDYRRPEEK